jgi:Spy/CpxP family protein refolding chaperone
MSTPRATSVVVVAALLPSTTAVAAPDAASHPPAPAALGAIVAEIGADAAAVRGELRAARAQRDVIKTLCLNDKLNQLDVTLRTAEAQREAALASPGEAEALAQAQTRLEIQRQTARRVAAEAQQCVGQPDPGPGPGGDVAMTEPTLPSVADYPAPVDVITAVAPPLSVSAYK